MSNVISSASMQFCYCCVQHKLCRMYILQMGEAAWVCQSCREPTLTKVAEHEKTVGEGE